jgi:trimethylamine-N-oxide reductase cytochrome c-type subunit TorC
MAALAGVAAHHLIVDVVDATAFCVSCHSMDIPAEEYRRSMHYRNPSGMRAECPDCHVPRQFVPNLWAKAVATRDLWGELTGSIDTAEKYEARRLDLAQRVWAKMESSDSRECRACHAFDAMDAAAQTDNANLLHSRAAARGDTCISCHKGLAHAMPDMGVIVKAARADLEKTLGVIPEKTAKVYLPTTSAYFLAADGQTEGGRMMAGIGVDYLGRQGDLAHVRLKGWRQEGEDSVLYAEAGKRILAARLNAGARGTPTATGREVTLVATGQRWSERTLEVWLPAAKLTAGDTALWGFASALYSVNCAICHAAPRVNEYDANQWLGRFKAMVDSTPLSEDEQSLVQTWLQRHASDAGAPP